MGKLAVNLHLPSILYRYQLLSSSFEGFVYVNNSHILFEVYRSSLFQNDLGLAAGVNIIRKALAGVGVRPSARN
jgi:hypothetical protein